ncbi:Protein kinase-like domain containing protein [Klebsormidium nitens]|uniref:Protein kinase-like domain containing protein n=1 Tax=Klebsormidium nitens TaxID=105231 RepID=A0A1Y1I633_KLENI|nr:Protein kinase-like domain containing protein [Klebsormidium nitens]|eukprot:GAQ84176.1 Protein kinase-like domain containing protein [Klebsormidium nitens]
MVPARSEWQAEAQGLSTAWGAHLIWHCNAFRASASGLPDQDSLDVEREQAVAKFYKFELLRMLKVLLEAGIIHGDLKPDNLLLRKNCAWWEESLHDRGVPYHQDGAGRFQINTPGTVCTAGYREPAESPTQFLSRLWPIWCCRRRV